MSSTEPPSRIPPRKESPETKAAREELSSKGKVEKVREIDADEQTRKQKKWRAAYHEDDTTADTESAEEKRPTPFDLYSQPQSERSYTDYQSKKEMGNVEDTIVPSPSYSPPPDVSAGAGDGEEEKDEATAGALPQSDDFWEDVDFPPDPPINRNHFQETPNSSMRTGEPKQQKGKKEGATGEEKKTGAAAAKTKWEEEQHEKKASPFGPPGKPAIAPKGKLEKGEKSPHLEKGKETAAPVEGRKKPPSLFEEAAKTAPRGKYLEEKRYQGPGRDEIRTERKRAKERAEEAAASSAAVPMHVRHGEQEGGGGKNKERDRKVAEIEISSLPSFPGDIQNHAVAAAQHAMSNLHPSTVSLFFQMVGTMYVMSVPPGITRTEIVLNNPSYANSRFFGSTITIEKYATAPDSFNIRLTGSDAAVTAFRDNIPSLMAAFQQGNFAFKVNRLDVEYEKPIFRRKEKGEDKGEAGSGGLGERRK